MRLLQVAVTDAKGPLVFLGSHRDQRPTAAGQHWPRRAPGAALDLLGPLGQCDHSRPRLVVVTTATQRRTHTTHATLIALTVNELRRLFDALVLHSLDTGGPCWHGRDGCDHHWAVQ